MKVKCLDTYALVEIAYGNPNFTAYLQQEFVIPDLILAEFYSWLLREHNEQTANYWYKRFLPDILPMKIELLIGAIKFRYDQRKKKNNFSFFDAAGYVFAIRHDCVFVTGDGVFKDFPHVEFKK